VDRAPFGTRPVRRFGQRVDTRRIDPAVVKVEQRTDCDREIQLFIGPPGFSQSRGIFGRQRIRLAVDAIQKPEQQLVFLVQRGLGRVADNALDEREISEQLRRNCGVRLDSKRASIP
jgi:hypothetical protein